MTKIVLLFISFFNLLTNNIFKEKETNDFFLVLEEENNEDIIIYKNDDVLLKKENNNYILNIKNEIFNYNKEDVKVYEFNNNIYVFFLDHEELYYDIYNKNGALISLNNLISDDEIKSYNIINYNDDLWIYYHNNVDSWVKISNEDKNYSISSGHHEVVMDAKGMGDYIYFLIRKDTVTEGLFGNGGTEKGLVIAKFDTHMNLKKYIALDDGGDDELVRLEINDNKIYLIYSDEIHIFSIDLDAINKKHIGNNLLITTTKNGLVYSFLPEKIDIYDGYTFQSIASISLDTPLNKVELKDNALLITTGDKKYIGDVIDKRELHQYKYLTSDNLEYYLNSLNNLNSIFGPVMQIKKEYSDYFKEGSYGLYYATITYKTKGGVSFNLKIDENYPLECNIQNNIIYPVGYRIIFNGEGVIDGNVMISNYQIKDIGSHLVEINGNGKKETFNIYVDHNQKSLSNNPRLIIDDYKELKKKEKFYINYNLGRNVDIKNIETEGLTISSYELKDNTLSLSFDGLRDAGFYFFYLDYIDYEEEVDGRIVKSRIYIHDEYWYYIPKDNSVISNPSYDNEMNYSFNLVDEDGVARFIQFELINSSENYLYNYPLGSSQIVFNNLPNGDYVLVASLVSDIGRENLESTKLFSYNVRISDDNSFGEIKTSQDNSKYLKIKITINKDFLERSVNEITHEREILYVHEEISTEKIVIFSVVGVVSAILVGYGGRYLYFKYKKQENIY